MCRPCGVPAVALFGLYGFQIRPAMPVERKIPVDCRGVVDFRCPTTSPILCQVRPYGIAMRASIGVEPSCYA